MLAVFASLYFGFDTGRSKMSRYLEGGEGEKEGNQTTYSRMDQVKFLKVLKVFFWSILEYNVLYGNELLLFHSLDFSGDESHP